MIPAGNTNFHLLFRKCASTDVFRNGEKTEVCKFMGQRGKKYKRFLIAKKEQQTCSFGEHNTHNAFPAGLKQWFADENI